MFIVAPAKQIQGRLRPVNSKSISNRALLLEALAKHACTFHNLSDAEDTRLLKHLLQQIKDGENHTLHANNCGTAYRFLTAFLCLQEGVWILTGDERMQLRPIGPLVDALRALGAEIKYLEKDGFPPLSIHGKKLYGKAVKVDAQLSSQYVSALMMIGPLMQDGLTIAFDGEVSSFPYLEMTASLIRLFGGSINLDRIQAVIAPAQYKSVELAIESDWSAASYFYELAALSNDAEIVLEGLHEHSTQGDSKIASIMTHFGIETKFVEGAVRIKKTKAYCTSPLHCDLSDCPDLAPALFATCAGLGVPGVFTGTKNLKIKESDRASSLALELEKTGRCKFQIESDRVFINPIASTTLTAPLAFETHADHRLAMAFAPLAIRLGQIEIKQPEVVEKSYPKFWEDLNSLGFSYPNR